MLCLSCQWNVKEQTPERRSSSESVQHMSSQPLITELRFKLKSQLGMLSYTTRDSDSSFSVAKK